MWYLPTKHGQAEVRQHWVAFPVSVVQQQLQPSLPVGTETSKNPLVKSFGPNLWRWKPTCWVWQTPTVYLQPAQLFIAETQPAFHQRTYPAGLSHGRKLESGRGHSLRLFSPLLPLCPEPHFSGSQSLSHTAPVVSGKCRSLNNSHGFCPLHKSKAMQS